LFYSLRIGASANIVIALVKFRIFVFEKQGEKMGIKMPDIDKIMAEDVVKGGGDKKRRKEQAAATKAGTARSFTIMDSRCRKISIDHGDRQALDEQ